MEKRRTFDSAFQEKAVALAAARGNVPAIAIAIAIAIELGIEVNMLYRWRKELSQYEHNSFPGRGKPKMTDKERELADVRMERDILKKAIGIFSMSDKKSLRS
ncbi:MAG: transposase [Flavobacteriales bacterium]|nr:transposase [Flavobacteriales bacterium]